jgi:lysophospholipase L1-like esterase
MKPWGISFLLGLALLASPSSASATVRVVIVGDSIVRDYPPYPLGIPIQGWGHDMPQFFTPEVIWNNQAVGGTSTKSYIANGYWATALSLLPDYVLISSGYNDSLPDPNLYSDPNTTYRQNLHQMVTDARAQGAEPIFVTPPCIRVAAADGYHVLRPNGLEPYANAMSAQASADGVLVLDLQSWTLDTYDALGMPTAQSWYGFVYPPGFSGAPPDLIDRVHFSIYGADKAAHHVADQIRASSLPLAQLMVPPVPALPSAARKALVAILGLAVSVYARGWQGRFE